MRRSITPAFYQSLVDTFREYPGNVYKVANEVKKDPRSEGTCGWKTADKAWKVGWPALQFKPIKDVLHLEELSARRQLEKERQKTEEEILAALTSDEAVMREKAREDAIVARVAETRLVREARQNAIELLSNSKELLRGFGKFAPRVVTYLQSMKIESDEDVERAARVLWRIATSARSATEAGMKVLQMERLLLGQPTEIIGVKDVSDMSDTDALNELEEAARAAERVRERRKRFEAKKIELASES
jgi:hypothetical protein